MTEAVEKVTIKPDTTAYTKTKSAAGGQSQHNGDTVAAGLAGATLDNVYMLAADVMDVPENELRAKYSHLNDGMQRMALGNRLRGWIKKADKAEDGSGTKAFNEEAGSLQATIARVAELAAEEADEEAA